MRVFVYGTLTDPERASDVLDEFAFGGLATLSGLHRVQGDYPTLAPGGSVEGRLLETDEVHRLDAYEGVDSELYVRVTVPLRRAADGRDEGTADVYVGDPHRLAARADWPGDGAFVERVVSFLDENDVVVWSFPERRE